LGRQAALYAFRALALTSSQETTGPVPYLSLVVPAYNEERRLLPSLRRIDEYLSSRPYASELVVVDDGSTDRTPELVRGFTSSASDRVQVRLLDHERNRGKGAAVRTGCLAATGKYVVFTDMDLAVPVEELGRVLERLEAGVDVAVGTRLHPGGQDMRSSQPPLRRLAGRLFVVVRRLVALPEFHDTQCPLKGFRRQAAQRLFAAQRLSGWAFDVELLYLAKRWGLQIEEVPVRWDHVAGSRLGLRPRVGAEVLWDLMRLRFLHR
jgi:dolichyl-phosphate beta-glucosyltransferase